MPECVERSERFGNLHGRQQLPQRVELNHDFHLVAHAFADLFKRLQRLFEIGRRDVLTIGLLGGAIKRPDLHGRDALREKRFR